MQPLEGRRVELTQTGTLRRLLIAITLAGVSLPHVIAGEVAGSLPSLAVGILVGLGCLRLSLAARSAGGRALGAIGIAAAALAPVAAYLAQEAAEHEPGLEAAHTEPNLLATVGVQVPLLILAIFAMRLLINVVKTVVGVWRRPVVQARSPRTASARTQFAAALVPGRVTVLSSNGQRAPPRIGALLRLAPQG